MWDEFFCSSLFTSLLLRCGTGMAGASCGAGRGGNYDSTPASCGEDGKNAKILVPYLT